jgi:hypothetical protein
MKTPRKAHVSARLDKSTVDEIKDPVVDHIAATRDPASISTSSFPQIAADYALAMLEEGFWDDEKGSSTFRRGGIILRSRRLRLRSGDS